MRCEEMASILAATGGDTTLLDPRGRTHVEGCLRCHSLDGQPHIGPTWLDLYLRRETLESGEAVIADEAYLTDSMIDPRAKVVKGFKPIMPTYKGRLAAPEAAALVEFIKSLRSTSLENLPSKEATYEPAKPSQRR